MVDLWTVCAPPSVIKLKYYVCVCLNLPNWLADSLFPLLNCRDASCYHVSRSLNLTESVCVRHSPQEALHSLCCSFHSFCGKCKIRRMRKASVVYALVIFVSVVLEILINSTSLTEYTFRIFSSSTCVLNVVLGYFTILCPFSGTV